MYTVYGIYKERSSKALYVGSTKKPILQRFSNHMSVCLDTYPAGEVVEARRRVFREHRSGAIKLVIREISRHESRQAAFDAEYETIARLNPPLNAAKGYSRHKIKRSKFLSMVSSVPKWYLRYRELCEKHGLRFRPIPEYDVLIDSALQFQQAA